MTEEQIRNVIEGARDSIAQYLEIRRMYRTVNVATNAEFRRKYNAFYRVRQRNEQWYQTYYEYMEDKKGSEISFSETLRYFRDQLNRYEPSFSSKLVATNDPNMPILDSRVLKALGLTPPNYLSKHKYSRAEVLYRHIQDWYSNFHDSENYHRITRIFNEIITEHDEISNTKKVDFVLWKLGT